MKKRDGDRHQEMNEDDNSTKKEGRNSERPLKKSSASSPSFSSRKITTRDPVKPGKTLC